jgi:hypothetical protein
MGHVRTGATEIVRAVEARLRERPGSKEALIVYGVVILVSAAIAVLIALYLG